VKHINDVSGLTKIKLLISTAKRYHDKELELNMFIKLAEKSPRNKKDLEQLYKQNYEVGIQYDNAILCIWLEHSKFSDEEKEMFKEKIESEIAKLEAKRKNVSQTYAGRDVYERIMNEIINAKKTVVVKK